VTAQGSEAVEFQCKTKSTQEYEEIKDEIDFSIAKKSGKGVSVKVKYEQEVEIGTESKEDGNDDSIKEEDQKDDDAKQDEQEKGEETMQEEGDDDEKGEKEQEEDGLSEKSERATAQEPVTETEKDDEYKEESSESEWTVVEEKLNVSGRQLQAVQETEYETEFEVVFERILEYVNADGSGSLAYDWDSDIIVQEVDLNDLGDFQDFQDDGNTVTFQLSSVSGPASFHFTISRSTVEGAPATANKMKIDVTLIGFPW